MYDDIDDDYYKQTKNYKTFNGSYVKYQSDGDKDKRLSIKEYLNKIKPILSNIINYHKDEWKIQLSMKINFVSLEDSNETPIMYTNSDNIDILNGYETDEIIEKLFKSLLERYQGGLEEKMREGSGFVFESVDLLYYKLHKTSLNRGGSYIDSPKWLKNKTATINPKNNDDKCFQYAIIAALNYQIIKKDPQII